jgi:hypothetical protein
MSSKAEGHWQWEGGDPKGSNMPPHIYKEGKMIIFPCSICSNSICLLLQTSSLSCFAFNI